MWHIFCRILILGLIQNLSDEDCLNQIKLIQSALSVNQKHVFSNTRYLLKNFELKSIGVQQDNDVDDVFIDAAMQIAHSLLGDSVKSGKSRSWIGLEYHIGAQQYHLTPIGPDLYNGTAGIALFLASLASVTSKSEFSEGAVGAMNHCLSNWFSGNSASKRFMSGKWTLGGFTGIGGVIYVLTKLASLLDEHEYLENACALAELISQEDIERDTEFDIVSGSAGLLLGLLELYRTTEYTKAIELADICGVHLVNSQNSSHSSAWKQAWSAKPLAGMGHGVAGIAYALIDLFKLTNDEALLVAARKGIQYENSLFSPDAENWLDLREDWTQKLGFTNDLERYMVAWCHGSVGIGYSRLVIRNVAYDKQFDDDLGAAISSSLRNLIVGKDHLCCGITGRIDFLFEAGRLSNDTSLIKIARDTAFDLVGRSKKLGHWFIGPNPEIDLPLPGLMQGYSGIGMALLRLTFPEMIPNVLILK